VKRLTIILAALTVLSGCDRGTHPRMIGSPAPDFTITDSERTVSLHDFRGKPVVLNFWASWCQPCIEEMPSLIRMQKQMAPGVVVLAVDIRDSEDAYHKFLVQYHIELLTVRDAKDKSADLYNTTGQPETFIIDSKGILRRKLVGPMDWTSPEMIEYLKTL
jgi:cytochrome c biogenesis protein CcmG, thiol:disulfide interchange protein DsbE